MDDLISREALKEKLKERYYNGGLDIVKAIELIDNAAPVEMPKHSLLPLAGDCDEAYMRGYKHGKAEGILKASTRSKGEWIKEPNGRTTDIYRCSVCKRSIMLCKGADLTNYPFCHCGADMRTTEV